MSDNKIETEIRSDLEEVKKFIKDIQFRCQNLDTQQVQKEVQEEFSRIVVTLQKIEKLILKTAKPKKVHELKILVVFLQLAVESLLKTIPNIYFAASLRTDIRELSTDMNTHVLDL